MPSKIQFGAYGSSWEQSNQQSRQGQQRGRTQQGQQGNAFQAQDQSGRPSGQQRIAFGQQGGAGNQQNAFGNRGGGGARPQPSAAQPDDWRLRVNAELLQEPEAWPSSCYATKRDGPNDLEGDFSREEARWAQLQAARAGVSRGQLADAYQQAVAAQQQRAQALMRQQQLPSDGGPPIPASANPWQHLAAPTPPGGAALSPVPATPVNQMAPAFGSRPPAGGAGAFGAPPNVLPFGAANAGGFGNMGFGQQAVARPVFGGGQQAQQGFGASSAPAFGFQSQQPGAAGQLPAFGAPKATSLPAFGQPVSKSTVTAAPAEVGMETSEAQQPAAAAQPQDPWLAERFEPGRIPEDPPPPIHCN